MHLNLPPDHPPHFVEKLSSMKPVLGAKKVGDSCPRPLFFGRGAGGAEWEGLQCRFLPTLPIFMSPYCSVLKSPLCQLNLGHY